MILASLLVLLPVRSAQAEKHGPFHPEKVDVWFSPKGGCTEARVARGFCQKHDLRPGIQLYIATHCQSLAAAKKRGVLVEAILDKSQRTEKYSEADFIAHANISTFIDTKHTISHNKVIIIDGNVVITGSFNFTKAAESSNAEICS